MKYVSSKKLNFDEEQIAPNDLIRSASVKSGDSRRSIRGDGTEAAQMSPRIAPPAPAPTNSKSRSWLLPLALLGLLAVAATGLGLGAASLAKINSNEDTVAQLRAQIASLQQQQQAAGNRGVPAPATVTSQTQPLATNSSQGGSYNSTQDNMFPEVLLRSNPKTVDGYSYAGSLYRGAGYWAVRPSIMLDDARFNHAVVNDGSMIYIMGGKLTSSNGTSRTSDDFIRFDAVLGLYGTAPSLPEARSAAAAALSAGKIYVIGGYANGYDEDRGQPVTSVLVYDVRQGRWTKMDGPSKPRAEACATAVNGKVYVMGGYRRNHSASDTIEMLDPATGNWTQVGKTPRALGNVGCASVGNIIYIAGGTPIFEGVTRSGSVPTMFGFNTSDNSTRALTNMTMARSNFQLVAANDADGSIMAIGGQKLARMGNKTYYVGEPSVEAYLPRFDAWIRRAPMANARFSAGAAAVGSAVYVFGGNAVCSVADNRCKTLMSVESLQFSRVPDAFVHLRNSSVDSAQLRVPESDVVLSQQHNGTLEATDGNDYRIAGSLYMAQGYWALQDDLPTGPLSDMQVIPVMNDARQRVGALLTGGLQESSVSNETWLFDAVLNSWAKRADMPEPRTRHAAAMLNNKMYIVGGFDSWESSSLGDVTRSMLVYDLLTNKWSTAQGPNVPRTDACAAAVEGKIYVAGGYSGGFNSTLDIVEVYDTDSSTWSLVAAMPTPRGDVMCAALNGELVVLGGYYDPAGNWTPNSFRTEVESFSPIKAEWRPLKNMPVARGDMAIAELPNGRLMVMGGETTNEQKSRTMVSSNGVFEYISSQDIWVNKAPMIETRFRFDAAYLNNAVYVFGGDKTSDTGDGSTSLMGYASIESYQYTPVPDVFVWMKVPSQ